jgi:two-component system, NtrC family, response regulator AlgB
LKILIVDDDPAIRSTLATALEADGYKAIAVADDRGALRQLEDDDFAVAFLDLKLGTKSGLDLLPKMLELAPTLKVILMTAYGSIETAVRAMKLGAFDYLTKPFKPVQIKQVLGQALRIRKLEEQMHELETQAYPISWEESAYGPLMKNLLRNMTQAANSDASILLLGESGTGKSALARFLHEKSPRSNEPYITVNCPSLPHQLLESELFGHARGAFTGAVEARAGKVAAADGGTLFLEEIGDLPLTLQPKLLRLLQEREYERVGESQARNVNIRVIAATNRDLKSAVSHGAFREDLYFRLNVISFTLPPLRERLEDLLPLAKKLIDHHARTGGKRISGLSDHAEAAFRAYFWPGNIRELRNIIERAVIFATGNKIDLDDLPAEIVLGNRPIPALGGEFSLEQIEAEHLRRVLEKKATIQEAAELLEIDPTTLLRKRRKLQA